jgi:hypothetical protein
MLMSQKEFSCLHCLCDSGTLLLQMLAPLYDMLLPKLLPL